MMAESRKTAPAKPSEAPAAPGRPIFRGGRERKTER